MIFYFLIFVFGLIVGSFLNVVVLRMNTGEPLIKSRSKCFSCGHQLQALDLIPLLSFLALKGRCRYCQSRISRQYPLVELITGFVFVFVFLKITHYSLLLTYYWLIFSILIAVAIYDLRHQIIPDKLVYSFILLAIGYWLLAEKALFSHLLAGLIFFGFFASLWLISRGKWLGFGDAKLALGLGFLLGSWNSLAAFLFSFWLGGLVGIFLMTLKKKRFTPYKSSTGFNLKTQIPFGPFLAAGAFLAFLIGDKFIGLLFGL